MQQFIDFFSFSDPNVLWVLVGVLLMCASSAVIGTFTYLRKRALVGDAVSHAILPGICLSYLIFEIKSAWVLLPGALFTGGLSLWAIDKITSNSKIKTDTAIALVLSVFYGFGILLLTFIQNTGAGSQSGLDKFLFGKAASLVLEDVLVFSVFSLVLLILVIIFFNAFKLITFDEAYAQAIGYPVRHLERLLALLTVIAVAIGIQAVGVVLMAALLITPAASARYWTNDLRKMLLISALLGTFAGLVGTYISYTQPKMPTGPWVVMALSFTAIFSVLFGTKKGVLKREIQIIRNRNKMLEENILKCLYHLGETDKEFLKQRSLTEIQEKRMFNTSQLRKGLAILKRKNLIFRTNDVFQLTEQGFDAGKRITKIHRLWELYLTTHLRMADDHVHEDAEAIEHLITPALERQLETLMGFPEIDPHAEEIPY